MSAAIMVAGLTKQYRGLQALDGLSFEVQAGEVFGLLGPNGAGKSTAVRCLATLTVPDGGRAVVAGADVVREAHLVRQRIGYVSQGLGADREATARENLLLHGRLHRLEGRMLRQRTEELLERVGLTAAADRLVRTYSGGMKRRLDIALGLLSAPQVLFLDEPTTGLDPESRAALWQDLRRLKEQGLTILLTTHYLEEADQLADRLAIVSRGKVISTGRPEDLKIDVPATIALRVADAERSASRVERIPGVLSVRTERGSLSIQVRNGQRLLPEILRVLEADGDRVVEADVRMPTLDDVYAIQTGRPFPESDLAPSEHAGGEGGA